MTGADFLNLAIGFLIGYYILSHYAAAARPA